MVYVYVRVLLYWICHAYELRLLAQNGADVRECHHGQP